MLAILIVAFNCVSGCGPGSTSAPRGKDPLTIAEFEAELDRIPRPLDDICNSLSRKQDCFNNYLKRPPDLDQDPETVKSMLRLDAKDTENPIVWAEGYSEDDVVAFDTLMSWDACTGGGQRGVRVTADWTLYVDKRHYVIAYSRTVYRRGK